MSHIITAVSEGAHLSILSLISALPLSLVIRSLILTLKDSIALRVQMEEINNIKNQCINKSYYYSLIHKTKKA